MRLFFFIANKQGDDQFQALGLPHKEEFCHRREVFFHLAHLHRRTLRMACAQAVALGGAPTTARRHAAAPRDLPPLNMAYDKFDNDHRHVNGVA